ncbi:hypothetical protein GCM10023321_18640 [Pseudonocardia eucalypti]|uniref:Uncharacterized protein n=1 Tax=Pseudonocardia eucalypti TaxID=648755 RepID=A0ABP9PSK2_9PSEU|nr:hypothetical protein [Pseudonocardia eucalypti]
MADSEQTSGAACDAPASAPAKTKKPPVKRVRQGKSGKGTPSIPAQRGEMQVPPPLRDQNGRFARHRQLEPLPDLAGAMAQVPGGLGVALPSEFEFAGVKWTLADAAFDGSPIGFQLAFELAHGVRKTSSGTLAASHSEAISTTRSLPGKPAPDSPVALRADPPANLPGDTTTTSPATPAAVPDDSPTIPPAVPDDSPTAPTAVSTAAPKTSDTVPGPTTPSDGLPGGSAADSAALPGSPTTPAAGAPGPRHGKLRATATTDAAGRRVPGESRANPDAEARPAGPPASPPTEPVPDPSVAAATVRLPTPSTPATEPGPKAADATPTAS